VIVGVWTIAIAGKPAPTGIGVERKLRVRQRPFVGAGLLAMASLAALKIYLAATTAAFITVGFNTIHNATAINKPP
jgi:hypothetical protein